MNVSERAEVASLAHGLAHEVTALNEARQSIDALLLSANESLTVRKNVGQYLRGMIDARKDRIAQMGAQVASHA